jgi:hypothetical protein
MATQITLESFGLYCLEGNMGMPQAYQQRSFDLHLIRDSHHLRLSSDFLAALQGSPEQR